MKRMILWSLIAGLALFASGCSTSYLGKVDVMGVGIGHKSVDTTDSQYVDESSLSNISVAYTPDIEVVEQKVSETTKYIAGEALTKEYKGEPQMLSAWMNEAQGIVNAALLIDKNGVVAWHGYLRRSDVSQALGVEGYSLFGGTKRISFDEAIKKYVGDLDEQDFEEDKVLKFEKGFFDYGKEGPFVYTKLPDFKVTKSDGEVININSLVKNGKPTLLIFFIAKGKEKADLMDAAKTTRNIASVLRGGEMEANNVLPRQLFTNIEKAYLFVK